MDDPKKPAMAGIITPSMLWSEFVADFLNRSYCRRWVIDHLHPSGPCCPRGHALTGGLIERYYEGKRLKCPCGVFFTAFSRAVLSGTIMEAHQFVALLLLHRLNVPNGDIARVVGLSQEAVRMWRRKLRLLEVVAGLQRDSSRPTEPPITEQAECTKREDD